MVMMVKYFQAATVIEPYTVIVCDSNLLSLTGLCAKKIEIVRYLADKLCIKSIKICTKIMH